MVKKVTEKNTKKQAKKVSPKPAKQESLDDRSAQATLRYVRVSAQKARLVVNMIRNKQVEPALRILRYSPKKTAKLLSKLLLSAIANARERKNLDVDKLWVTGCWVNHGPTMKRFMPRARGSANQILKRSSHITVVVTER